MLRACMITMQVKGSKRLVMEMASATDQQPDHSHSADPLNLSVRIDVTTNGQKGKTMAD